MKKSLLGLVSFISLTISAFGHPTGHDGHLLETAWHMVSQPNHLLAIALSLVLVVFAVRSILKARKRQS